MWRLLQLLAIAVVAACGQQPPAVSVAGPARRIASLSPALTATLISLGWKDRVVGRTPWCAAVEPVPVVGSLLEVDLERLDAARPELVLVQRTLSGPPSGLTEAARQRGWRVVEIPCTTLEEVRGLEQAVQQAVGERGAPTDTEARWSRALQPVPAAGTRSPAALLFAVDPPQAFGTGTYLGEIWRAWGGRSLPETPGHPSLRLEDLASLPVRSIWIVGATGHEVEALEPIAKSGVSIASVPEPGLLRPGPELLPAVEAWRRSLEWELAP